jgi:hypothetical protein
VTDAPTTILAIDPGSAQSAWCLYGLINRMPIEKGILPNAQMLDFIATTPHRYGAILAVEMIASYGMAVGREVFDTCVWIGRYVQAWQPGTHRLVYRREVKMHLCGTMKAKDTNIRQALVDRFGGKGTKASPGGLFGFKSDMYAALAVAVTAAETK